MAREELSELHQRLRMQGNKFFYPEDFFNNELLSKRRDNTLKAMDFMNENGVEQLSLFSQYPVRGVRTPNHSYALFMQDQDFKFWKKLPVSHISVIEIPQVLQPNKVKVIQFSEGKSNSYTDDMICEVPYAFVPEEVGLNSTICEDYMKKILNGHGLDYYDDNGNVRVIGPHPDYPAEFKHYLPVVIDYGCLCLAKDFDDRAMAIANAQQCPLYAGMQSKMGGKEPEEWASEYARLPDMQQRISSWVDPDSKWMLGL